MKTRTVFILSLTAILILAAGSAFGAYSGGTGEPSNPYQIANKDDLLVLAADANDYNQCFILTADINMGGQVFTTAIIADGDAAFTGTFDGNGHKIANFTINDGNMVGLFGQINSGGSVKNLGLENCVVSGYWAVGGLVGFNYGSISNCYSTGAAGGTYSVGGLVGFNEGGTISNCYSTGAASGTYSVGGLVGYSDSGSISDCYSTSAVSGNFNSWDVGGLVGYSASSISDCCSTGSVSASFHPDCVGGLAGDNEGTISNCYSTSAVSGNSNSWDVGGLVGWNNGIVSKCYSTGAVSGSYLVGGLVGINGGGSISNCYSTGALSGDSWAVGGLVGRNYQGSIINCYSTGAVSGSSAVGGLVGVNNDSVSSSFWDTEISGQMTSDGGTGKTTSEMKTLSTFTSAGWDFVYVWGIGSGQTYPYLKPLTGFNPADLNYDGTVDFADFAIFADNWLMQY
ncbi:MAG: GLUG motif-containing protein [Sedimentisphaerales bacterium]